LKKRKAYTDFEAQNQTLKIDFIRMNLNFFWFFPAFCKI